MPAVGDPMAFLTSVDMSLSTVGAGYEPQFGPAGMLLSRNSDDRDTVLIAKKAFASLHAFLKSVVPVEWDAPSVSAQVAGL
jgi:hypothetical protein